MLNIIIALFIIFKRKNYRLVDYGLKVSKESDLPLTFATVKGRPAPLQFLRIILNRLTEKSLRNLKSGLSLQIKEHKFSLKFPSLFS